MTDRERTAAAADGIDAPHVPDRIAERDAIYVGAIEDAAKVIMAYPVPATMPLDLQALAATDPLAVIQAVVEATKSQVAKTVLTLSPHVPDAARERTTPDQPLRFDFTNEEAMARLSHLLNSAGDDTGLREAVGPWFVLALLHEYRTVVARRAEAGAEDTKRLDWLQANGEPMGSAIEMEHNAWLQSGDLRASIDAARAGASDD